MSERYTREPLPPIIILRICSQRSTITEHILNKYENRGNEDMVYLAKMRLQGLIEENHLAAFRLAKLTTSIKKHDCYDDEISFFASFFLCWKVLNC
jgi:hypothetical protein